MRLLKIIVLGFTASAGATAVNAQDGSNDVSRLLSCKNIADATERLACYDRDAAIVEDAQDKGEIVVIDKDKAEEIKKERFGFRMPSLPNFGGDDEPDEDTQVFIIKEYKVKANGRYTFYLANGQVWQHISGTVNRAPKGANQTLSIRNAAMGSFLAQINGKGPGLRVKRIE